MELFIFGERFGKGLEVVCDRVKTNMMLPTSLAFNFIGVRGANRDIFRSLSAPALGTAGFNTNGVESRPFS